MNHSANEEFRWSVQQRLALAGVPCNDGQVQRTEDVLSAGRLAAIALLLATAVVETAAKLRSLKLVMVKPAALLECAGRDMVAAIALWPSIVGEGHEPTGVAGILKLLSYRREPVQSLSDHDQIMHAEEHKCGAGPAVCRRRSPLPEKVDFSLKNRLLQKSRFLKILKKST